MRLSRVAGALAVAAVLAWRLYRAWKKANSPAALRAKFMAGTPRYIGAVTRHLPNSFVSGALSLEEQPEIDLELARRQHADYTLTLRQLLEWVVELKPLEVHPDCCFVEDTAVLCEHTALLTSPGHPSRRGEVETIQRCLSKIPSGESASLQFSTMECLSAEGDAHVDGGDVLMAGPRFSCVFVGLSSRSNMEGVERMKACFDTNKRRVIPIQFPIADGQAILHLKSVVTACGPRHLIAADIPFGRAAIQAIRDATPHMEWEVLFVPEAAASNLLLINGVLVHRAADEIPKSVPLLQHFARQHGLETLELSMSENAKADGALTCCSLLVQDGDNLFW